MWACVHVRDVCACSCACVCVDMHVYLYVYVCMFGCACDPASDCLLCVHGTVCMCICFALQHEFEQRKLRVLAALFQTRTNRSAAKIQKLWEYVFRLCALACICPIVCVC